MGTPNTLFKAIKNGLNEAAILKLSEEGTAALIKLHVQDFHAQIFTVSFVEEVPPEQMNKVWSKIKAA